MAHPRIRSVKALESHRLEVEFDNGQARRYDVAPLLEREMFLPLRNPVLFRAARVEPGGFAVVWNDDIDLSEHEIWTRGEPIAPARPPSSGLWGPSSGPGE